MPVLSKAEKKFLIKEHHEKPGQARRNGKLPA